MKQMEPPKCRLCEKNHWAREGCYGMLMHGGSAGGSMATGTKRVSRPDWTAYAEETKLPLKKPARALIGPRSEPAASGARSERTPAATGRPVSKPNTSREGRRVLKGSTPKASGAKPTRTASTERADPSTPASAPAEQATGEKPAGGTAKPRKAAKKKSKKKGVKK